MEFRKKIDKVLSLKGIKLYKLAEISGLGNTLEKAYQENREMKRSTTERLMYNLGIIPESWHAADGPAFKAALEEKHTHEQNQPAITEKALGENPEEIYRRLVEGDTEYVLIPRAIFEDKYKLVAIEKIEQDKLVLEWLLRENEKYAAKLRESQVAAVEVAKKKTGAKDHAV